MNNLIDQYVSAVIDHGTRQCHGYDPFTIAFHETFSLEALGLDESTHKTSFLNRTEVQSCRDRMKTEIEMMEKQLKDCNKSQIKSTEEFHHLRQLFLRNHVDKGVREEDEGFVTSTD